MRKPPIHPKTQTNAAPKPDRPPVETAAPVADSIAARAYELWVEQGKPAGAAERNWKQAEAEVNAQDLRLP